MTVRNVVGGTVVGASRPVTLVAREGGALAVREIVVVQTRRAADDLGAEERSVAT
jgi:hypothetical protein